MNSEFIQGLDALGQWRHGLQDRLATLRHFLDQQETLDEASRARLDGLRLRIAADKLVVAFVAEFSRGKSELINAIFFADTGQRILPATPGRTTMCPVELGYEAAEPPAMALLPIETRLEAQTLDELRLKPNAWKLVSLDPSDPQALARAMKDVTQTRRVSQEEAAALGFWDPQRPQDNPTPDAEGRVEVPAWRHAMINYPHPLLKQGLVVLDTPGLNAIGAEPELTLSLLPSAHAAVFILGADTGVTRSDLTVWTEHLGPQALARFVALNKIDTLSDPLLSPEEVEAQIVRQCQDVAETLQIPTARVFPLSARQALAARIARDEASHRGSRLPSLEAALASELMPQRHRMLAQAVVEVAEEVERSQRRQCADRRRQAQEQLLELRGLRGKNDAKVGLLLKRVQQEAADFEQCVTRVQALRAVQMRLMQQTLDQLSAARVREGVDALQATLSGRMLQLGARKAFVQMCGKLRLALENAQTGADETHKLLGSYFNRLNTEYGFTLQAPAALSLAVHREDLDLIERNYEQYLGFTHTLRLTQARFQDQFRRMLATRLRTVFEKAALDVEQWNQDATALVDVQLRDRRRDFRRRQDSLERVQGASAELEARIEELQGQCDEHERTEQRLVQLSQALTVHAAEGLRPVRMPVLSDGRGAHPPAAAVTPA